MGYSASGPLTAGLHFADGGTLTLDVVNSTFLALILLRAQHLRADRAGQGRRFQRRRDPPAVPPLRRDHGHHGHDRPHPHFSDWVVSVANPTTFGVLAFLSAGVVNFFVPSGGGQFAVQSPVMLDAAARLGVDPSVAIMAIASLKMRDILGCTMATLIASGLVFATVLLLIGAEV